MTKKIFLIMIVALLVAISAVTVNATTINFNITEPVADNSSFVEHEEIVSICYKAINSEGRITETELNKVENYMNDKVCIQICNGWNLIKYSGAIYFFGLGDQLSNGNYKVVCFKLEAPTYHILV